MSRIFSVDQRVLRVCTGEFACASCETDLELFDGVYGEHIQASEMIDCGLYVSICRVSLKEQLNCMWPRIESSESIIASYTSAGAPSIQLTCPLGLWKFHS